MRMIKMIGAFSMVFDFIVCDIRWDISQNMFSHTLVFTVYVEVIELKC